MPLDPLAKRFLAMTAAAFRLGAIYFLAMAAAALLAMHHSATTNELSLFWLAIGGALLNALGRSAERSSEE